MTQPPLPSPPPTLSGDERDILLTLFDLGRKVLMFSNLSVK